jgi:hypothetical protein
MGIALFTTALFVLAVAGLILVATAPGYLAVILFLISVVQLAAAFIFLYAQGLPPQVHEESQGDGE